ncbi:MAG: tail fiber protein [Methyloprofundus sp.]|nr:tail fiber protein [Methyloprofundus sp.]
MLAIEDYPSLFAAIGTTWEGVGGGDGITTFNLPLLTDRVTRAAGTAAVGELQEDQNKSHNHTASTNSAGSHTHSVSGTAASAGNHSHSVRTSNDGSGTSVGWRTGGSSTVNNIAGAALAAGAHTHGVSGSAASSGAHSHTVTVNSDGGAEVRVKAGITLKCIWAK